MNYSILQKREVKCVQDCRASAHEWDLGDAPVREAVSYSRQTLAGLQEMGVSLPVAADSLTADPHTNPFPSQDWCQRKGSQELLLNPACTVVTWEPWQTTTSEPRIVLMWIFLRNKIDHLFSCLMIFLSVICSHLCLFFYRVISLNFS